MSSDEIDENGFNLLIAYLCNIIEHPDDYRVYSITPIMDGDGDNRGGIITKIRKIFGTREVI